MTIGQGGVTTIKKGERKNPNGRPKGVKNKITASTKEMIKQALEEVGGVEYLKRVAVEQPKAFVSLVAKLCPQEVESKTEITGADGGPLQMQVASVKQAMEILATTDPLCVVEGTVLEE